MPGRGRRGLQAHQRRGHLGRSNTGLTNLKVWPWLSIPRPPPRSTLGRTAGSSRPPSRRHLDRRQHGPDAPTSSPWPSIPSAPATLYAGTWRRGLQEHRRRRHMGRRQHGTDEPRSSEPWPSIPRPPPRSTPGRGRGLQEHRSGGTWTAVNTGLDEPVRPRPGHRSLDPRHSLRRDGRRGLQVHRFRRHLGRRQRGLVGVFVGALAVNPATPTTLYAGTDGGVFDPPIPVVPGLPLTRA